MPSLAIKVISYLFDYLLLLGNPNSYFGAVETWKGERLRKERIGQLWAVGEQSRSRLSGVRDEWGTLTRFYCFTFEREWQGAV